MGKPVPLAARHKKPVHRKEFFCGIGTAKSLCREYITKPKGRRLKVADLPQGLYFFPL
jgi:hypothetical protein